ncbi:MAG TPA: extracellular solute-binding protein [Steroidobacteraceae bacterium]|nr:extracellular solute-binding protein [Steroidobacteraceae bacterium]
MTASVPRRSALRALTAVLVVAGISVGCGSDNLGGAARPGRDAAQGGGHTLEVWTPESGTRLQLVQQRAEQFSAARPDVKVNFTVRDFGSYPAQLKLALASDSPPDVVIGNLGWSLDGPLIKAGMLRALDPWVARYHWDQRFPEVAQRQMRFTADGKQFGRGAIFGIPYAADVIGWFYNVDKLKALNSGVPATLDELDAALATARKAGEVPIMLGNKPQWPSLHLFYLVSNDLASDREINGIVFGDRSVQWTAPGFVASARKLAQWNAKGYIAPGANSMSPADALARFVRGAGVFLPAGSWNTAELAAGMGDNVAFFLMPPVRKGDVSRATGSVGYGWHITAASRQADLAAEFIDFMTQEAFAIQLTAGGDISPIDLGDRAPPMPSRLAGEIFSAWRSLLANGALLPYLDFAAPNAAEVLYPTMQSIIAGQVPAEEGLERIERSRQEFLDSL